MEAIKFPEQNETLAKSQPQFRALPVCIRPINSEEPKEGAQYTVKYELSEVELAQILLTRSIYFSQFGFGFQPICPQIESPFGYLPIKWEKESAFGRLGTARRRWRGAYSRTYCKRLADKHTAAIYQFKP